MIVSTGDFKVNHRHNVFPAQKVHALKGQHHGDFDEFVVITEPKIMTK